MDKENVIEMEAIEDPKPGSFQVVSTGQQSSWAAQFAYLKKCRQSVFAATACSSAAVLVGFDLTLIGSIIANKQYVKSFGVYDSNAETWTLPASQQLVWTIVQFGAAFLGAFAAGLGNDKFGRQILFYMFIAFTTIGTTIELVSPNWKVWVVAKLFMGWAMGSMWACTPTYVSELVPQQLRGFMLALFQFWIMLGSFLASCVLEGTSRIDNAWSWKAAVVSQYGMGLVCLVSFVSLVPESPYYLIRNGKIDKAKDALLKLRKGEPDYDVDMDIESITQTMAHEKEASQSSASYLDCFRGSDLRRTLLACLPLVMQQVAGYQLCGGYLAYFLTLSGLNSPFVITVVSFFLGMIAVLVAFALIEKVGRRTQFLGGALGMLPCLAVIAILGFVGVGTTANGNSLAAFSIIWNVLYFLSLGAVGWTITGEMSSLRLRAKTTSIAAGVNSLLSLASSVGIPYLLNAEELNLGPKAALCFLVPSTFLSLLAYFVVPETKGKSFDDLNRLFEAKTPAREFV
ncbi:High-affinity glucose transporter HXT2 [Fusarium falciforme]|uniref:High-affinity glucose transporter HXT2 n=1 Tax=Fusarium falciforme TaxID=195108 RepID=UPI002300ABA1|nr:High-affinity glucose transporter HXT2 [Fusarium falciforme]WAO87198.1 High-affinity glucose transporter HXT2 [Fusarium falciforme]